MNIKYTSAIKNAIKFSIKTHEVYQKQKRKGKDIPYITHPMTVGLILALSGASEEVIVAGILHDTIEDSSNEKKVNEEMISKRFGKRVADLVMSVTEKNKDLSWEERKKEAIKEIADFSHDALLLKSADVLSNATELIDDYEKNGEAVFANFNASKDKILKNYLERIRVVAERWDNNPLKDDLELLAGSLQMIWFRENMYENRARHIPYHGKYEAEKLLCPACGWKGTVKESGCIEYSEVSLDVSCPICGKMLLVVGFALGG